MKSMKTFLGMPVQSYTVSVQELVPRKWELELQFTSVSGQLAESFQAKGGRQSYKLSMTAKVGAGKGWEMGLELWREKDLARYLEIAKQSLTNSSASGSIQAGNGGPATNQLVHIVEKGQDLYTIAEMYGVTLEDLLKANAITNWIKIGQALRIPLAADTSGK